jgi:hypothetical protein
MTRKAGFAIACRKSQRISPAHKLSQVAARLKMTAPVKKCAGAFLWQFHDWVKTSRFSVHLENF